MTNRLSIDLGWTNLGVCITSQNKELLFIEQLTLVNFDTPAQQLYHIYKCFDRLILRYNVSNIFFEKTIMKNKIGTYMYMVEALLLLLSEIYDCNITPIAPKTIKKVLTGDANATKKNILKEVLEYYSKATLEELLDTKYKLTYSRFNHVLDAIALSLIVDKL